MRYKHLTTFYGSVERALAYHQNGDRRYFHSVHDAVQEALKIGESGPFDLVTRVELVPDQTSPNRGDTQGPGPPVYWEPPIRQPPDPDAQAKADARRQLQSDMYSALINFGCKKGDAQQIVRAMPPELIELSPALNWAFRQVRK